MSINISLDRIFGLSGRLASTCCMSPFAFARGQIYTTTTMGAGTTCIAPYSSDGPLPASNVAPWCCALTRSRKPGPLRSGRSNGCATACGGSARKLNVLLQPLGQSCGALPSSRLAYQDRQSMPSFNFHFEKGRLSFPVVTKHNHHLLLWSC